MASQQRPITQPGGEESFIVPSLTTTSLRALADTLGENIKKAEFRTAISESQTYSDVLPDYGLDVRRQRADDFSGTYNRDVVSTPVGTKVRNPIDDGALFEELQEVKEYYEDSEGNKYPPDYSTLRFTAELSSKALKDISEKADNQRFDLSFEASAAESNIHSKTENDNEGRGLYVQGFNVRNLNLHRVTETVSKFENRETNILYSWDGPGDTSPFAPRSVGSAVFDLLPDDISVSKTYRVNNMGKDLHLEDF